MKMMTTEITNNQTLTLFTIFFIVCSVFVLKVESSVGIAIADQSTAKIYYDYYSYTDMYEPEGGSMVETGYLFLVTDMTNQKLFLSSEGFQIIAPYANSQLNTTLVYLSTLPTYEVTNRQCYVSNPAYGDYYWWLSQAADQGYVPCIKNPKQQCQRYAYIYDTTYYDAILDFNSPANIQQMNITDFHQMENGDLKQLGKLVMNFNSFEAGVDNSLFVEPTICTEDQSSKYFCSMQPGMPATETNTVYYLHSSNSNGGEVGIGPNVGDLLGYAAYLCWGSSLIKNQLITKLNVEMLTAWGQYAICYSLSDCQGGNSNSVGREAPYGFFDLQGQCDDLSTYGQWWSITKGAMCSEFGSLGTPHCAWKQKIATEKTISFDCLVNRGYFQECAADGKIPFTLSAKSLSDAFIACPNIVDEKKKRGMKKDNLISRGGRNDDEKSGGVVEEDRTMDRVNNKHHHSQVVSSSMMIIPKLFKMNVLNYQNAMNTPKNPV